MLELWKLMGQGRIAKTPCLMVNVHPTVKELPKDVKIVLVHGSLDETWPVLRGYNHAGAVGFEVKAFEATFTDDDGIEQSEIKYQYTQCARTLEGIVQTGSPGLCYLYHTPDEQSGLAQSRPGDSHIPQSLLQFDCLPRLIDALLSAKPPYTFPASCAQFTSAARHEAEVELGMDPATLRNRWWQSPGKKGTATTKRFDVASDSKEFRLIATIFKAEPADGIRRFYKTRGTADMQVRRVERVENGRQQESFDSTRLNIKADLEGVGVTFWSGVHSRWLFHGAADATVLAKIVDNNIIGFAPTLNERGLWGKGVYFARDAAYSVGFCSSCRDEQGFKMMLLCQVEVGLPCCGESHMVHMPQMHPERGEHYHSFVDSPSNPEMFVVEHASQASPAYIIHFT